MRSRYSEAILGIIFLLVATGVLLAYQSAWSGSFHFDDQPNLAALSHYLASGDAWAWILSGEAGPGGRPVALASFLLDAPYWPHDPSGFLYTNTLIHVLNGLLLALVLVKLAHIRMRSSYEAYGVGLTAAALWLALPLLASTSLLIIQRMTLLAATFMWAGLWMYLMGRDLAQRRPVAGTLLMSVGVIGGAGLGFLSKENAAILPLLVLITELTLLNQRPLTHRGWLITRLLLLGLPSALVLFYLAQRLPNLHTFSPVRGFTLNERLATQALILWDYLRLLFLPRSFAFMPFHDAYPVASWSSRGYLASIAGMAWLVLALVAVVTRRRWPLFAFAVLWYLGAHLIESSVIMLELYFEHRNYVPAIGPVFALVFGVWQLAIRFNQRRLIGILLGAYLSMLLLVLTQTTSLWGQPRLAAEIWYQQQPASLRAAPRLADLYIREGDLNTAAAILDRTLELRPESVATALQALQLACQRGRYERIPALLVESRQRAINGRVDTSIIAVLDTLKRFVVQKYCNEVLTLNDLEKIVTLALGNPAIWGGAQNRSNLYIFLASIYIEQRDLNATIQALERAWDTKPDLVLLSFAMSVLNSAGLYEVALDFALERAVNQSPNPLRNWQWQQGYAELLALQRNLTAHQP